MDIIKLKGLSYASNTYVIISGTDAAVVDPSVDVKEIINALNGAKLRYILLTHGHFDHILKLDALRCETKAEICIYADDAEMLTDPELNASEFFGLDLVSLGADRALCDGEILQLGREIIEVIHTPGHTPGSVCYDCGYDLVCGDTLFTSGYGRYDLHGGDVRTLSRSLHSLKNYDQSLLIYPGHGDSTTLGQALRNIGII